MVDTGRLEAVVDRVYRFSEIAEAFACLEAGHAKGKVVVRMDEPTVRRPERS